MDKFIQKLRAFVEANPILFDSDIGCDSPALDALYWQYSEFCSLDSGGIKAASRKLRSRLVKLSYVETDEVFGLVWTLCAEHERVGFFAGLRVGVQLILALVRPSNKSSSNT